jgi:hypothetical protein
MAFWTFQFKRLINGKNYMHQASNNKQIQKSIFQ